MARGVGRPFRRLDLRPQATIGAVNPVAGSAIVAMFAVAILVTASSLRTRMPRRVVDVLLALEGAGLAVGGLFLVNEVGTGSWIAGPVALALMTPLHVRVLFAGEGPFRT
jgi:hypothetical protein